MQDTQIENSEHSGVIEYPFITKDEIIEYLRNRYGGDMGIASLTPLLGTFLILNPEICLIKEDTSGGFESPDGIRNYNISLYDLSGINIKSLQEKIRMDFNEKQYYGYLENIAIRHFNLKLKLWTELSEEENKWAASFNVVRKPFFIVNSIFEDTLEYVTKEFKKETDKNYKSSSLFL